MSGVTSAVFYNWYICRIFSVTWNRLCLWFSCVFQFYSTVIWTAAVSHLNQCLPVCWTKHLHAGRAGQTGMHSFISGTIKTMEAHFCQLNGKKQNKSFTMCHPLQNYLLLPLTLLISTSLTLFSWSGLFFHFFITNMFCSVHVWSVSPCTSPVVACLQL